jgi:hypothetical protein
VPEPAFYQPPTAAETEEEESGMQPTRTALAAIIIAAAAAPNASAMVAADAGNTPAAQHTAEPARASTRLADELALRKALRNRELPQAESAPIVGLVRPETDGFDWSSALIGASVPFALLLAGGAVRPALARRRSRTSALA